MTSIPPPPQPLGMDAPGGRPTRSRWLLVAIVAVVIALGAVGLTAVVAGDGDGPGDLAIPTSQTPSPPAELSAAQDLDAKARPYRVVLTWATPSTLPERAHYEVRRDDTHVGDVDPPTHRFVDDDVVPGERYRYEVRVVTSDGTFSDPAVVRVRTPLPPIVEARLQGTFDVKSRFTAKSGYGNYDAPGFGWRFRPKCGDGPCDVALADILHDELRITLRRSGGTYRGTYTGKFTLACGNTDIVSSVTLELRVATASVIDGSWRATRLAGTLSQRESSQLGCSSSSATLALTAKLYR